MEIAQTDPALEQTLVAGQRHCIRQILMSTLLIGDDQQNVRPRAGRTRRPGRAEQRTGQTDCTRGSDKPQ